MMNHYALSDGMGTTDGLLWHTAHYAPTFSTLKSVDYWNQSNIEYIQFIYFIMLSSYPQFYVQNIDVQKLHFISDNLFQWLESENLLLLRALIFEASDNMNNFKKMFLRKYH